MRIRHSTKSGDDTIELQMTPMIDIVFQLLVFFIMTFNVVAEEGDFNIKMPQASISQGNPDPQTSPPIVVRLTANPNGTLSGIFLNERALPEGFAQLRREIIALVGGGGGPDTADDLQVELDCDYDLSYEYAIEAITHVSGDIDENGNIIKLIENIKFSTKNISGNAEAP